MAINNWRKHQEDRIDTTRSWRIDPFFTAIAIAIAIASSHADDV